MVRASIAHKTTIAQRNIDCDTRRSSLQTVARGGVTRQCGSGHPHRLGRRSNAQGVLVPGSSKAADQGACGSVACEARRVAQHAMEGLTVEYVVMPIRQDPPAAWAMVRESEGWHGIGVGDHWYIEGVPGINHPFVALGVMAASTKNVALATLFANNLVRSPVELALASLTMHAVSGGRFELGLGAGWARQELVSAGLAYPEPRERARRLHEAVQVVRQLFRGGCQFEGEYYRVDLPAIGPAVADPPRITAALGGRWTMDHIGPLVDTIEVAPHAATLRGGEIDFEVLGRLTSDELRTLVARARDANPAARVGLSLYTAAGAGRGVDYFAQQYKGGAFAGMAGPPAQVAYSLNQLSALGVDRITAMPVAGRTEDLAAALFA